MHEKTVFMAKKKQTKGRQKGQQFLSPDQYVRQKARTLEIGVCYVSNGIEKDGEGHVIVSRRHTGGRVSIGVYLVDTWCVGVKDSYYRLRMEEYEFEDTIKNYPLELHECSYDEAHNRIFGAIAFAEEAGIAPHKSFAVTRYMLEEDTDDVPLIEYNYGRDGKHTLVASSRLEASRYLPLLRKNLGEGNYDYLLRMDSGYAEEDDEDNEDDEDDDWKYVYEPLRMADLVAERSKDVLLEFARLLDFDIDESLSEDEVRREYVGCILDNPLQVLAHLPMMDINALEQMRDDPTQRYGVFVIFTYRNYLMEVLGMAKSRFTKEGHYQIVIADDFARAVLPVLAKSLEDVENKARIATEVFIEGMANLYGEVSVADAMSEMRKLLEQKTEEKLDVEVIFNMTLETSISIYLNKYNADDNHTYDNIYFMSPYGWDDDAAQHREMARLNASVAERRQFTYEEIVNAGSQPVPIIPNSHGKEFEDFLSEQLEMRPSQVEDACFNLWRIVMCEEEEADDKETAEDYFEETVLDQTDVRLSGQQHAEGRRLLKAYIGGMPRWTLKGHAAEEF